ncbi:MAG: 6,7-dimethyl-8-ribityllumazine synthase [Planctomycetota bacterium]
MAQYRDADDHGRPSPQAMAVLQGIAMVDGLPDEDNGDSTQPLIDAGDRVVVIASRYNAEVCVPLMVAAVESLRSAGLSDSQILVTRVPGAWELALQADHWLRQPNVAGAITLGAVIKGETTHDQYINASVSDALMQSGLKYDKPVGFGLLTCNTAEQALARSGGDVGNKGHEAADAVIEMLRLSKRARRHA